MLIGRCCCCWWWWCSWWLVHNCWWCRCFFFHCGCYTVQAVVVDAAWGRTGATADGGGNNGVHFDTPNFFPFSIACSTTTHQPNRISQGLRKWRNHPENGELIPISIKQYFPIQGRTKVWVLSALGWATKSGFFNVNMIVVLQNSAGWHHEVHKMYCGQKSIRLVKSAFHVHSVYTVVYTESAFCCAFSVLIGKANYFATFRTNCAVRFYSNKRVYGVVLLKRSPSHILDKRFLVRKKRIENALRGVLFL